MVGSLYDWAEQRVCDFPANGWSRDPEYKLEKLHCKAQGLKLKIQRAS